MQSVTEAASFWTPERAAEAARYLQLQWCVNAEVIYEEGSSCEWVYLVHTGTVVMSRNKKMVMILEKGACFGEVELITGSTQRQNSVVTGGNTLLLKLHRSHYPLVYGDYHENLLREKVSFLSRTNLLQRFLRRRDRETEPSLNAAPSLSLTSNRFITLNNDFYMAFQAKRLPRVGSAALKEVPER